MFRPIPLVYVAALAAGATLFLGACGDSPGEPIPGGGDPENISRVTVTLTGGGATLTSFRVDPDGTQLPQPVGPAQGVLALKRGTTYNGAVGLLNDLDPAKVINIIEEVTEEANFHRFFYELTCAGVTVPASSLNQDTQTPPQPLGTTFQVVVNAEAPTSAGCTLRVQLRHFETDKGDGAGTNFETDLDIEFPVTVTP